MAIALLKYRSKKFRNWYGKEALLAKPVLVDVLLTDFRQ